MTATAPAMWEWIEAEWPWQGEPFVEEWRTQTTGISMASCKPMSATFIYDWGQEVRVTTTAPENLRPGKVGSICGMREFNKSHLYLVEFSDGQAIEILEEFLTKEPTSQP